MNTTHNMQKSLFCMKIDWYFKQYIMSKLTYIFWIILRTAVHVPLIFLDPLKERIIFWRRTLIVTIDWVFWNQIIHFNIVGDSLVFASWWLISTKLLLLNFVSYVCVMWCFFAPAHFCTDFPPSQKNTTRPCRPKKLEPIC